MQAGGSPIEMPKLIEFRDKPLPKTKLESPRPHVLVSGRVTVGGEAIDLDGWPGMVGHNWGAQHAERWIWLHGVLFEDRPDDWLDIALGRIRVGPVLSLEEAAVELA